MVDVTRPSQTPVVTGTVKFVADPTSGLNLTPLQSAVRSSSGSWTLTIKGLPAGTWNGAIVFTDVSGTHATSSAPVQLTIAPGPTPSPTPTVTPTGTPTPTPSPTVKPSPTGTPKPTKKPVVDGCVNQIKN
jgi:hypothetical protein